MLGAARAIAEACDLIRPDWNGFNVLHRAAARVGALDIGFVPGGGGKDVAGIVDGCRSGSVELLYLLGADELDFANTGSAFVIYQGHHGDRGAARADVVLPGCAYTEKDATYVNTEGRVQLGRRAVFPPGEAREDWAILRALSGVLGRPLPFDSLHRAAPADAGSAPAPRACRRGRAGRMGPVRRQRRGGRDGVRLPGRRLLPHRPDQPRQPDDGRVQRNLRRAPRDHAADRHAWLSGLTLTHRRATGPPFRMRERYATPPVPSPIGGERGEGASVSEFWWGYGWPTAIIAIEVLIVAVPLLLAIAYYTYAERKVLAFSQLRKGPNVVGPFGLLQPIADGVKMLHKETIIPSGANRLVFIAAPMVTFTLALVAWAVIPFDFGVVIADINVGILYLFAISSLSVYGVIMAGWASNSRYAFLGALRAAAQMVSYEVSIGFVLVTVLLCAGSLNLSEIVLAQRTIWFVDPAPADGGDLLHLRAGRDEPGAVRLGGGRIGDRRRVFRRIFVDVVRAVLSRRVRQHDPGQRDDHDPVSGRLAGAVRHRAVSTLGAWHVIWFLLKVAFVMFCILWVRATFPRFRYDQLMRLGWKVFLPFSLAWLVLTAGVLVAFDWLPR